MGRVERDQLIEVGKIYLALFVVLCSKALFNMYIIQVMGVTLKPDIEVSKGKTSIEKKRFLSGIARIT